MSSDNNTYSEEFMQKSWDQMHTILDKEIPQKKNRRPLIILLSLFLFIGFLGVGGYLMLHNEKVSVLNTPTNTYAKIENVEKNSSITSNENSTQNQEIISETNQIIKKETVQENTEPNPAITSTIPTTRQSVDAEKQVKINTKLFETSKNNTLTLHTKKYISIAKNIDIDNTSENQVDKTLLQNPNKNNSPIEKSREVQLLDHAPLAILNLDLEVQERIINKSPSLGKIIPTQSIGDQTASHFSLGLSAMSDFTGGVNGANIDIGYSYPISSKFAIETRIGSSYFSFSDNAYRQDPSISLEDINLLESDISNEPVEFSENLKSFNVDSLLDVYNGIPSRIDFHLMAGLNYKLNTNLALGTGLKYRRFVNGASNANEALDIASPVSGPNNLQDEDQLSIDPSNYNHSFLNPYISANYKILGKLHATIEYEYFLKDFVKIERSYILGKNNSLVSLGLKYDF